MRVESIGQENNSKSGSVLKAGAMGAVGGALVRSFAPLTTEEHDLFFNSSAQDAIKQKVKKVRGNEVEKIIEEFGAGKLNVSSESYDIFVKHKAEIAEKPKSVLEYVKDAGDSVKNGLKSLTGRVDAVGAAKEQIEVANIKNAAKSARPMAYFLAIGALVAMSGQVLVNAFNNALPKEEKTKEPEGEKEPLTMADILLEGLGSNTEILFLTNESLVKDN